MQTLRVRLAAALAAFYDPVLVSDGRELRNLAKLSHAFRAPVELTGESFGGRIVPMFKLPPPPGLSMTLELQGGG